MSKRICLAFALTERKVNRTLREKYIDVRDQTARNNNDEMRSISAVFLPVLFFKRLILHIIVIFKIFFFKCGRG